MKPCVLLLMPTSSYRASDFLNAAESLGVDVVVASEESSTMEALSGHGLLTLPFRDEHACVELAARFHREKPLHAVVPVDEQTAVVASRITEALGLFDNPPVALERARRKDQMRSALDAGNVASPEFRVLDLTNDPARLSAEISYPAVLKPVFLSGSQGVSRVDDAHAFEERFRWLRDFLSSASMRERGGALCDVAVVERFVPGPEVAVEAILTNGDLRLLALFDKPDPLDGPFFEETIYVTPSRLADDRVRQILDTTAAAAGALGLRHGPVHAELRLPPSPVVEDASNSKPPSRHAEPGFPQPAASPVVIEVAGRSIGGLCSRVLSFGVGMSLEELILRHALGEDVTNLAREGQAAGVMMLPIPKPGKLEEVRGLDRAEMVEGIVEVTITMRPGSEILPVPEGASYLGFVFARGSSPESVERALRRAQRELEFVIE